MADDVKNAPNRVDGVQKVTGKAKYIAEWKFPKMAYGYLVHSTIAKGKIKAIDTSEADKLPGVVKVLTHLNTPKFAKGENDRSHRPLHNADVLFNGDWRGCGGNF
jgi:xanthine dehydrogenase YagR molybdenum-binding subunit